MAECRCLADDAIRAEVGEYTELGAARVLRSAVGQVDDLALTGSVDRCVRLVDEAGQALRQPVIAPGLLRLRPHALLYNSPAAVIGDNETVEVDLKTVLHRRAVDFGHQPARGREHCAIKTDAIA